MKKLTWLRVTTTFVVAALLATALFAAAPARARCDGEAPPADATKAKAAEEVTLHGTLGCGKCSFHEASACENVLKVKTGDKEDSYVLADNAVSEANHEKVCGPSAPATVTGTVAKGGKKSRGRKILTASAIKFD